MADVWRGDWSDVPAWFAPMGQANGIAIHHTASAAHPENYDPALLRQIEHGEIAAGYNALAYHTMVFNDGFLAESRPYGSMGAATGGHNDHTIAFCFIGYFHPDFNHVASEVSLRNVAAEIARLVDLGFLAPNYVVWPHRTWTAGTQWATACCGDNLIPRVPDIDAWSHVPPPALPAASHGGPMDAIHAIAPDGTALLFVRSGALILKEITGPPVGFLNDIPDSPETGPWLNGGAGYGRGELDTRKVDWGAMVNARAQHDNALIKPSSGGGGGAPAPIDLAAIAKAVNDDAASRMKS